MNLLLVCAQPTCSETIKLAYSVLMPTMEFVLVIHGSKTANCLKASFFRFDQGFTQPK